MNSNINRIIAESVMRFINESKETDEAVLKLIKAFLDKDKNKKKRQKDKKKKKSSKDKKDNMRTKKIVGGTTKYDYDEYSRKNKKISKGEARSICASIDTELTNVAAVARVLFPDHTDEGAQSQFRKIINGERPLTKRIAIKLQKMISRGQVATK